MSMFERNLALMQRRDPALAALMRSDIDCGHIEVIPSHRPGVLTARVRTRGGGTVVLHNLHDPVGSAVRTADRHPLKAENGSILLGFGLGYLAIELAKRLEKKHPLLICEVDPAIVKTALQHVDLSAVLDNDYVRILTGQDIALEEWIHRLSVKFMTAKVDVISYEPGVAVDPPAYERLRAIALKESRAIVLNRNTTLKAGRRLMENVLQNFPDVLRSAGVKNLEHLFDGRPAILVAAGPSLEKNVELLHEVKGRAVIIAADTTLRLLLPLGIVPDIVTTIDFNQKNFEKFAGVPIPDDVALVYHPGTYHESVAAFGGPRFTMSRVQNRIPAWLMQYVEDKGYIPAGTTVAHLSFYLARYMGCDPIVFIGQDLAFPDNKVHASDLSLWSIDMHEMDTTEDIFGQPVGTMSSFKHAIYHLEKAFKETRATVIDATEGGARKAGAVVMRLRDVLDRHLPHAPMPVKAILRDRSRHVESVRTDELLRELDFVSADLQLIQAECRDIITVSKRLQRQIRSGQAKGEECTRLSVIAERLTENMAQHGRVLHLMGEHNFALELYMAQHAVADIDDIEDEHDRLAEQVERGLVYYPSVLKAAAAFKAPLDRLIQRLKRERTLEKARETGADGWYRRAVAYRRIAYRVDAAHCAATALHLDPRHRGALRLQAELSLHANRGAEALAYVQRLRQLGYSGKRLDAVAQEADRLETDWRRRCDDLAADFARRVRSDSDEDAGWFYFRVKDYATAVEKWMRAAAARPCAETYARLGHARLRLGDRQGAMEAWALALDHNRDRPDIYKALGMIAMEQDLGEQAEDFLTEACRLEPDDPESQELLARVLCARGAYAQAGVCYEHLLRLDPNRHAVLLPQIVALYKRQVDLAATTQ